jgi:hypothetical protein
MNAKDAPTIWTQLSGKRENMIHRLEKMASYTIPKLLLPDGWEADEDGASQDYQSLGAQVVNHLTTKIMLALFAPTRPFLRLDPSAELLAEMAEAGVGQEKVSNALAIAEKDAIKSLDAKALRPKLFSTIKNLIVLGNVMQVLDEDGETIRVISIKHYCVKRTLKGNLHTAIIKEEVLYDELEDEVQALVTKKQDEDKVCYYVLIQRKAGEYEVTHWVNEQKLDSYTKTYTEDKLPYRVLTWDLADESDYGTGLVEDYEGDFGAVSTLSRAMVEAAILASEFRWLANPAGMTRPEDFKNSNNGECLPGSKDDLVLVQAASEVAAALQVQQSVNQDYINRIGRGFLLSSAVTRDAERVTAEEIRMLANELETGLGGAYSRLAVDVQLPLGLWLLRGLKIEVNKKAITPIVITGLDALSRNGDLENLRAYVQDVATIGNLPPPVLARLRLDAIFSDLASGRGLEANKYVKSEAEAQQGLDQDASREVATSTATAAGEAAVQSEAQ